MAKLLRHFGFGSNKKANNSNSLPSDAPNSKFVLESESFVHRSNSFDDRDGFFECGVSAQEKRGGGSGVDGSDGLSCSSFVSISGQQLNIANDSKYVYQTNSLVSLNSISSEKMKRHNAVKMDASGWTYKSATDGGKLVIDKPHKLTTSKSNLPLPSLPPHMLIKVSTLEEDYSEPLDLCTPPPARPAHAERHLPAADDDYSEPFQESASIKPRDPQPAPRPRHCSPLAEVEEDVRWTGDESVYDEVYESRVGPGEHDEGEEDSRPGEEYDSPWEWRHIPQLLSASPAEGLDEESTMSGPRPTRHIYETAFDSSAKSCTKDTRNDDEIINHPIFTSSSRSPPPREGPSGTSPSPTDNARSGGGKEVTKPPLPLHPLGSKKKTHEPQSVRALIHLPPRSANSTPTLSSYFREGGGDSSSSCASSAKSTPTHFLSKCAHHSNNHHLALRQFSDSTLSGGRKDILNVSTSSMPPGRGVAAAAVRADDPGLGSSSSGAVSSEESVASASSGNSSGYNNNGGGAEIHRGSFELARTSAKPLVSRFILQQKLLLSSEGRGVGGGGVVVDTRPAEDYDPPWDKAPLPLHSASASSSSSSPAGSGRGVGGARGVDSDNSDASSLTPPLLRTSMCDSDQENEAKPALDRPKRPTLQLSFNKEPTARPSLRPNLSLDLNLNDSSSSSSQSPPKLKRKDFILNFGCPMLSTLPDPVDTTIQLERQGWYHGAISRIEAENLLRILQEGSYLVRNSESSKNDYSLSLKSARGFMHMKIVSSEGKYILGQFSKPFNSIPEMIHHYSISKLPIKGAEHMSLLHPVIDQLL